MDLLHRRLHQADRLYQQAAQRASGGDPQALPAAGITYVGLGELRYEWDDLAAAEAYLRQGIDLGMLSGSWNRVVWAYMVLARLRHAQSEDAAAWALLDRAATLTQAGHTPHGAIIVAAGQARQALARGDGSMWHVGCTPMPRTEQLATWRLSGRVRTGAAGVSDPGADPAGAGPD